MKPLDPRLLRHARTTRAFLVVAVVLGSASALLIIVQAFLIAGVVADAFQGGAGLAEIRGRLGWLVLVALARAAIAWASESAGHRAAAGAVSELRLQVAQRTLTLGPAFLDTRNVGELTTLMTRGASALDGYFSRYLPQLVLAVVVPVMGGAVILTQDPLSAVVLALTIPLIPVFMVLIGRFTQSRVDRQWTTLGVLSGHFLDVVAGLPTLKIFNRARAQAETIRAVGEQYRATTMGVLRISFLSSLVLELLATLSVAIIAVAIGLRLVEGTMDLETGLAVLILAPEVYLPLRLVGTHFHAAAEGMAAAGRMLDILDLDAPRQGPDSRRVRVEASTTHIRVRGVTVRYGPRIAVEDATLEIRPGVVTALVGPSGSGKSTLLAAMLGLVGSPSAQVSGSIVLDDAQGRTCDVLIGAADAAGTPVADLPDWRRQVGWVPQSPTMLAGTVADNVRFGRPGFSDADVDQALRAAGLIPGDLAHGWATAVSEGGGGVSVGQARRIAVARAILADPPVLLLDEPTAALDAGTEAAVTANILGAGHGGRTVVVVTHRQAVIDLADDVLALDAVAT